MILSCSVLGDINQGIHVVLTLRRRIMNTLLTVYLPSVLILAIVYAANYFKPFFFESIISVNLTSQLVLTTLFISVSSALPPTSYIKMIDIWLIFSQLIPFVEVMLHTFMDNLRDDDDREINHHGSAIPVDSDGKEIDGVDIKKEEMLFTKTSLAAVDPGPSYTNMVARDEKQLVKARKDFYDNVKVKHERYLKMCEWSSE